MPNPGYGLIVGGYPQPGQTLPYNPNAGTGLVGGGYNTSVYDRLGIKPPEEDEENNPTMLGSIVRGAAIGLMDPLSFIDPVDRVVTRLREENEGAGAGGKVGYGLGYLAGFVLPGGVATKVGTYAARGVQGLTGLKLLRAAEAGTELTRLGVFAQGTVAGGLLSAGMSDAEGIGDFAEDVALGAVLGGVGDVAIQTAFKTLFGANALGRISAKTQQNAVENVLNERGLNIDEASLAGRAHKIADTLLEQKLAGSGEDLNYTAGMRSLGLRLGIDELNLNKIEQGNIRIVPNFAGNIEDTTAILNNFPELKVHTVTRELKNVDGTTRTQNDILVARQGDITTTQIKQFSDYGFIPGQRARWGGQDYILTKGVKDSAYALGVPVATATQRAVKILKSEMQLEDLIAPGFDLKSRVNPHAQWTAFVKEYGVFPHQIANSFNDAFDLFATKQNWNQHVRDDVKRYFTKRQLDVMRTFDDGEMGRVMDRIEELNKTISTKKFKAGDLEELAGQNGYKVARVGLKKKNGRMSWKNVLIDEETGHKIGPFESSKAAMQYVVDRTRPMRDGPGMPIADGTIPIPPRVGSLNELVNQSRATNVNIPWSTSFFGNVTPFIGYVRRVSDALAKELKGDAPDYYTPFTKLIQDMSVARSEGKKWLDELTEIRGGGLFGAGNIRSEKIDDFFDLLEEAKPGTADWRMAANAKGLNEKEVAAAEKLRDMYNRLFEVARQAKRVDIDGDDFIENYMPHFRKPNDNDWVKEYKQLHGREPSVQMKQFVNELNRSGGLTNYERDPFIATYRYVNGLMHQVHVSESWKKMQDMAETIITKRADQTGDNEGLLQFKNSLLETLSMMNGNQAEAFQTVRSALDSLNRTMGLNLDVGTFDRFVNTMIAANYGAFMGFRAALAVRNLGQLAMTTLPVVGPKYLGIGMKHAMREGSDDELIRLGIMAKGQSGMPLQDVLYYDQIQRQVKEAGSGGLTKAMAATGKTTRALTQKSLIPQAWSDKINRKVTYYAQKQKALDMLLRWRDEGWSETTFNSRVGLSRLGPTAEQAFHRMLPKENPEKAAQWLAGVVTADTQFLYQQGAGPKLFNSTTMRIFGMYGTWPSWYASFLQNNLSRGTAVDKAKFAAWTGLVHATFVNGIYATGVNTSKFTGLQFGWAGGPIFDLAKDASDIIAGEQVSGRPTAERQIALSNYGLRDPGPGPGLDMWQVRDPRRLVEGTLGMFMPGMYMARDIQRALDAETLTSAGLNLMGFQTDPSKGLLAELP